MFGRAFAKIGSKKYATSSSSKTATLAQQQLSSSTRSEGRRYLSSSMRGSQTERLRLSSSVHTATEGVRGGGRSLLAQSSVALAAVAVSATASTNTAACMDNEEDELQHDWDDFMFKSIKPGEDDDDDDDDEDDDDDDDACVLLMLA